MNSALELEERVAADSHAGATKWQGPLRVGLVGCGKMGLHHLRAIRAAGGEIVGVADPAASREELGGLIGGEAIVVPDAAELLNERRPDVVHIVTPPASHAQLASMAIRAGCHVYVEKPFTTTVAAAAELLALAKRHGVSVCAGHQVLFERPCLMALERLGSIGRLVHVETAFTFRMVRRTVTPVEQLKDILPHAIYPIVEQLRAGTGLADETIDIEGQSVRPEGDLYALLRLGATTAVVLVSLNGRPIEQYQYLVGTNGSLRADYIIGSVVALTGPGTGPGVLFTPYRRAWQTCIGATRGFSRLIFGRAGSYQGLQTLVQHFYASILEGAAPPISARGILDTVSICERLGESLDRAEASQERSAAIALAAQAAAQVPPAPDRPGVLVTGGTGLLGRKVAEEIRSAGFPVRVVSRRVPAPSRRLAGVEYGPADLSHGIAPELLSGVGTIVHCAAETAGGTQEQRRNSIEATRRLLGCAASAGVRRVIHISSLAVLKPSKAYGRPLDEAAPVDAGNAGRGPYVWGKAESEVLARQLGSELGLEVKIIRPGPLVDYAAFHPPGRLGRELGPFFVAIGPKHAALSVCDVGMAARVIRAFVDDFESAPAVLNLVDAPAPSRRDLVTRYRTERSDLRVIWFPGWLLRLVSASFKLAQRLAGSSEPLDVAAAFAAERYDTTLAARTIRRADTSAAAGAA